MSTKSKTFLVSAASVILAAVLWAYFEREKSILTLPGVILDAICSGKFQGGFGDARDFILIVSASWSFWMLSVLIAWRLFRWLRRPRLPRPSVASAEEFSRLLSAHRKHGYDA